MNPKQLESKVTKVLRQEAATSEEAAIKTAHGQIPADHVTRIPITMADIPPKFGIPPECIPETENIKEVSAKKSSQESYQVLLHLQGLPTLVTKQNQHAHLYPPVSKNKINLSGM